MFLYNPLRQSHLLFLCSQSHQSRQYYLLYQLHLLHLYYLLYQLHQSRQYYLLYQGVPGYQHSGNLWETVLRLFLRRSEEPTVFR